MKKQEIIDILKKVEPGLSLKELIPQSTCFLFTDGEISTFNNEVGLRHPIQLPFTGAIPAKEFLQFLLKVKQEEIELTYDAVATEVKLKAGRAKAGIKIDPEIKVPIEKTPSKKQWRSVPDNFVTAVEFCLFSAAADLSMGVLSCLHITPEAVESSDNMRITRFSYTEKMDIEPFLIPATSAREIPKMDIKQLAVTESWVHFKEKSGMIFSCRRVNDKFVDLSPHIKVEGSPIKLPEVTDDILDKATIFVKDSLIEESVTVNVTKGKFTVYASGSAGWFKESSKVDYKGKDIEFQIAPSLLKSILDKKGKCKISDSKMILYSDLWVHVLAI